MAFCFSCLARVLQEGEEKGKRERERERAMITPGFLTLWRTAMATRYSAVIGSVRGPLFPPGFLCYLLLFLLLTRCCVLRGERSLHHGSFFS